MYYIKVVVSSASTFYLHIATTSQILVSYQTVDNIIFEI